VVFFGVYEIGDANVGQMLRLNVYVRMQWMEGKLWRGYLASSRAMTGDTTSLPRLDQ
jgi:hypothetical protein